MLTAQLRQMEENGLLTRTVFPEVPPRVEYTLTPMGESFVPILEQMVRWGEEHLCPPDYRSPCGGAGEKGAGYGDGI